MRVVLHKDIATKPLSVSDAKMVLVYDDDGIMLMASWEREDGTIALTRAGEPDFEKLRLEIGADKRTGLSCVKM